MKRFSIEITSVPDRKNLVAEIWFGENLVAEVNHESDYLEIELYPSEKLKFRFKNLSRPESPLINGSAHVSLKDVALVRGHWALCKVCFN